MRIRGEQENGFYLFNYFIGIIYIYIIGGFTVTYLYMRIT